MAGSSNALDVSASTEDLKYIQALTVNVSNFVSVKLSGCSNYYIWKAQMLCLIKSQVLHYIIDDANYPFPGDKGMIARFDQLVKGWIFVSVNEKVLKQLIHFNTAREVWWKLESFFDPLKSDSDKEDSVGFKFENELLRDIPEMENTDKKTLYEAAVEGWWWKAKSTLKIHKNAATEAINENGDTILHVAVEMGQNYFVEKLLEFLKDGKDIETQNCKGRTALHIAAMVGNTHAAQLLVQKKKELLAILDSKEDSPLDIAYANNNINTYTYFLKSPDLSLSSYKCQENAILAAILAKQYDLARSYLEKYPKIARENDSILSSISITFPSDIDFMESLIYPSFHDVRRKIVRRVRMATLYPIHQLTYLIILILRLPFSMLYFLLWKVLEVTVCPFKNIEKKKKEYQEAKKALSLICDQMGTSNNGYREPILEAVRRDTYEVVDEILFRSSNTIKCQDEEGHNIIQLAIISRSEKVYNLIYHIVERTEAYRKITDSSMNTLAHLSGRLAPSFALRRTIGATLQLQRELFWHEEVKKLMSPLELTKLNINEETPAIVFTREHEDLMKQGENWLKTTAESCSITAALIVTIGFAAAITVPGGSNQESGIPVFKKEFAFTIFALSNALSLFTATTSLFQFLIILTTRYNERDFMKNLPSLVVVGLLMLILSTSAMMVAFGATLFLVFCDQRPWILAPICAFACMPISMVVYGKHLLFVDLIQSTFLPIFGKQRYLESCKINRKNTIFMD